MRRYVILSTYLLFAAFVVFDVAGQSSPTTSAPATTSPATTPAISFIPTRPPFNKESAIREQIIRNSTVHSRSTPPFDKVTGETRINITLTMLEMSRTKNMPHQMNLETLICMNWLAPALKWNPEEYDNVDWVTAYYWEVWTPRLMYFHRSGEVNSIFRMKNNLAVRSDGRCFWCYTVRLVMNCEGSYHRNCQAYVKLFGYPFSPRKFDQVKTLVSTRYTSSIHGINGDTYFLFDRYGRLTTIKQKMTTDELTLLAIILMTRPLDFARMTWPMLCILLTTLLAGVISSRGQDSGSDAVHLPTTSNEPYQHDYASLLYDLFSLRVSLGLFTAVICCLSIGDHSVHPALANEPYLSWFLSVVVSLGIVLLLEMAYPVLQARVGRSNMFGSLIKGNRLRWQIIRIVFVIVAVLILTII